MRSFQRFKPEDVETLLRFDNLQQVNDRFKPRRLSLMLDEWSGRSRSL